MKKKIIPLLATLSVASFALALSACFPSDPPDDEFPQIDNEVDLNEFTPSPDDDYIEGETYYTSTALDLVTDIHGNYTIDRPFTLDKEDENKRIYHNIYMYEEDFFQVLYYEDVNALGEVYAIMSDPTDTQYAEVEYTPGGSPLQINVVQKGVYNLVLDIETFAIDMVKVGDITTPVYETVRSCEFYVHVSRDNTSYTEMTLNPTSNEYCIQKYIPANASIGFFSASHMARYKTTVEYSLMDTLVYWNSNNTTSIQVHVGGTYNVYFHAKTYVVRLELCNPDTAEYFCQVGWQQGNVLTPVDSATPYLFEYDFVAQGTPSRPYVDLPSFYPELGMSYELTLIDLEDLVVADSVTQDGTYKLTINLKEFTLSIEKIA